MRNVFSILLYLSSIIPIYAQVTYTFTNAGANGSYGPSQQQIINAYLGTNLEDLVGVNNGIQVFTVPATGTYRIQVIGATGGNQNEPTVVVGHPANMSGEFELVAGQSLKILVGQHGHLGSVRPGWGGGGGSFVALVDNTPLIIAGGSGSGHTTLRDQGLLTQNASLTEKGKIGIHNTEGTWPVGYGAINGNGGDGAGYYGNGTIGNGAIYQPPSGLYFHTVPQSFINGGAGDELGGGFGGGGGVTNTWGGGGGGYTGGQGSVSYPYSGGGGGSLNTGANQSNFLHTNHPYTMQHGKVIIISPEIIDVAAPVLSAIPADISVECDAIPEAATVTAEDEVDGEIAVEFTETRTDGSCPNSYTLTRTWSATDAGGNIATASQTITVTDETAPELSGVPDEDIIASTIAGTCGATIVFPEITATDNCGETTLTYTHSSGSIFDIGTTEVTVTATDECGNVTFATFSVIVDDDENPTFDVPEDISINTDAGVCGAEVNFSPITSIEFSEYFEQGIASPHCDKWKEFTSQLVDGLNYQKLILKGSADPVGISIDDPSKVAQIAQSLRIGSTIAVSDDTYTWRTGVCGTDETGLPAIEVTTTNYICNCEIGYTVRPCIQPQFNNPNWGGMGTVTCNAPSQTLTVIFEISGGDELLTATDNCDDNPEIVQTAGLPSGSVFPVGTTSNTFEVTDASGNKIVKSFNVVVADEEVPEVITQNVTINLDENGSASITTDQINNGSSDACGIESYSLDITEFDCSNLGENTVTLTVTDVHGNSAEATAIVTVQDVTPPELVTKPAELVLTPDGTVTLISDDVVEASSDNCGPVEFSLSQEVFDIDDAQNSPVTIEVTASDPSGNTTTQEVEITVIDPVPVALCQNITVQLDENGNVSILPEQIDNGSSSVVGIELLELDISEFNCENIGDNEVILTVTSTLGRSATCSAIVTVEDNVAPVVVTKDITVELDANGAASITAADIDDGSTDACDIDKYSLDITGFDCTNVGANTVTLTVKDVNGNSASGTATVTVEDNVAPDVVTKDITVELDASGAASITAADIDDGSTDACDIDTYSLDITGFDCTNVGANTVTLTVKDVNGNSASGTATVTVEDNVAPVVVTKDITVELDANGAASITAADIDDGSTDACDIDKYSLDITGFDCTNVGANTVTLTVTDVNGNSASGTATVTVEDNVAPVVVTKDITVELDANGAASITAADIDDGSTDACDIDTYSLDIDSFTCDDLGSNTVTLTVTDINGNSASESSTVTVEDNIAPELTVPSDITVSNDIDLCGAVVALESPTATDNCEVTSLTNNAPAVFPVGSTTVTWTAVDQSGNSSEVSHTVTVTNDAPIITSVNVPTDPVLYEDVISFSATFVDNNLDYAEWNWGDGSYSDGTISGNEVYGDHAYAAPGMYKVTLTVTDLCDESDSYTISDYVVVYDPDAGFVTGGGWINSPAGAVASKPDATGKANFGFVARYHVRWGNPMGNFTFNFGAGDINFKSTEIEYLVLRNHAAKIKGMGKLNNNSNVHFFASIVDGKVLGFNTDYLRVKIWDETTGEVYYDSEPGLPLASEPVESIGNGSIVIHHDKAYDVAGQQLNFFPNPYTDAVQFNLDSSVEEVVNISIFDERSELVLQTSRNLNVGLNEILLDLHMVYAKQGDVLIVVYNSPAKGTYYMKLLKN